MSDMKVPKILTISLIFSIVLIIVLCKTEFISAFLGVLLISGLSLWYIIYSLAVNKAFAEIQFIGLFAFVILCFIIVYPRIIDSSEKRISQSEAEAFMQARCDKIGQTLMKTKTVKMDGIKVYSFMSVAENGMVCISAISELKLEVIGSDCGESQKKINEWNAF